MLFLRFTSPEIPTLSISIFPQISTLSLMCPVRSTLVWAFLRMRDVPGAEKFLTWSRKSQLNYLHEEWDERRHRYHQRGLVQLTPHFRRSFCEQIGFHSSRPWLSHYIWYQVRAKSWCRLGMKSYIQWGLRRTCCCSTIYKSRFAYFRKAGIKEEYFTL